jgi:hypothetical protein
MVEKTEHAAEILRVMLDSGKVDLQVGSMKDNYTILYTFDSKIAKKYGFKLESNRS